MTTMPETASPTEAGRCPIDHQALSRKKSVRPGPPAPALIERDSKGVWQVRGFDEARAVLRADETQQAGFQADMVRATTSSKSPDPVLYQEGKPHQEQRSKTARFFTPKTVSTNYTQMMETFSDGLVAEIRQKGRVDLSNISMALAVRVAAQVIGLTNSRTRGMDKRLDAFFHIDLYGTGPKLLNAVKQFYNLRYMLSFFWLDVRPAIAARRKQPQDDLISYLIAQGYNDQAILTECVTYAAAGMVTTREFIVMAAWHMLEHPELRARYLAAGWEEREAILHETLRLEPVVGHLFRRATADITLTSAGQTYTIGKGDLMDISVEAANLDQRVVEGDPQDLCPARPLHADRAGAMLMSFGDGTHRCPGAYLAIQETDIFLQRLLRVPGLRLERAPDLMWNELTAGYEVRRCLITASPA